MASGVVTVRVDPELLAALKAKVEREGTTVSAAIVRMLRAEVGPQPAHRNRRPTMGMFAGQFEDLEVDDFKRMRGKLSARLASSTRERRR